MEVLYFKEKNSLNLTATNTLLWIGIPSNISCLADSKNFEVTYFAVYTSKY